MLTYMEEKLQEKLNQIQAANLKMLKEIDRICRKHDIGYRLDSGTLIGAVRHKGFIPWDDDADIIMRRDDWERFREIAPSELPDSMELMTPEDLAEINAFYDFTPRIIYRNCRKCVPDEETAYYGERLNRLWIDIFLEDNIPDGKAGDFIARTKQKIIYSLAMGHRFGCDYRKYTVLQKIAVAAGSGAGKLIPMKTLCRWQRDAAVRDRNRNTKRLFCSNYQPDYLYVTIDRSWTDRTVYMPFEDTELAVPVDSHNVLKEIYGDYMQLPASEKRVPSHGTEMVEVYD